MQIIDGYRNGSILRIICGKDSDPRFDRSALILKSSIFTLDWLTKSQAFGFQLRFVFYDRLIDGKCPSNGQFQCANQRCLDPSLLCDNEDHCGDQSDLQPRHSHPCRKGRGKQQTSFLLFICFLVVVVSLFVIICLSTVKCCHGGEKKRNTMYVGGM